MNLDVPFDFMHKMFQLEIHLNLRIKGKSIRVSAWTQVQEWASIVDFALRSAWNIIGIYVWRKTRIYEAFQNRFGQNACALNILGLSPELLRFFVVISAKCRTAFVGLTDCVPVERNKLPFASLSTVEFFFSQEPAPTETGHQSVCKLPDFSGNYPRAAPINARIMVIVGHVDFGRIHITTTISDAAFFNVGERLFDSGFASAFHVQDITFILISLQQSPISKYKCKFSQLNFASIVIIMILFHKLNS